MVEDNIMFRGSKGELEVWARVSGLTSWSRRRFAGFLLTIGLLVSVGCVAMLIPGSLYADAEPTATGNAYFEMQDCRNEDTTTVRGGGADYSTPCFTGGACGSQAY